MRHLFSTIRYSQGWLGGQLEDAVLKTSENNEDPTSHVVASQIMDQWTIIDQALDDLIKENNELRRKISVVESALR